MGLEWLLQPPWYKTMKLTEHKTKLHHYFTDDQGRFQGEYKSWHKSGTPHTHVNYTNDKWDGECKVWHVSGEMSYHAHHANGKWHGELRTWHKSGDSMHHRLYDNGTLLIDFIEKPEEYPTSSEEMLLFVLKYGNIILLPYN